MILAIIIAVAIPLVFLYMVRWLDLYASGSFRTVLICFGWGVIAYVIAWRINGIVIDARWLAAITVVTVTSPIAEEFFKSLVLVYFVRRPSFTYFVDGAIYGFAAGTAFAVFENVFSYVAPTAADSIFIALSRGFTASLMHGSASALVGISLGRMRFGRGWTRPASLILGWAGAMTMHLIFNNVARSSTLPPIVVLGITFLIGIGGVGMCAGFIFWGLEEEKRWLRESLHLDVGVSDRESGVVQQMADWDTLLKPISDRFGTAKRKQVEEFLHLQALIGLKHKVQETTPNESLRAELAREVAEMRERMDVLRREVGVYCMSYVRTIMPSERETIWVGLGQQLVDVDPRSDGTLHRRMQDRMAAKERDDSSQVAPKIKLWSGPK